MVEPPLEPPPASTCYSDGGAERSVPGRESAVNEKRSGAARGRAWCGSRRL